MKAVLLKKPGDKSGLYVGEAEKPKVKEDYVLIKVHAFGLNRADIHQREGTYPPPPGASDILGLEVAGEVVETGPASAAFSSTMAGVHTGQRVMALLAGGGYSEYALAHVGCVLQLPTSYTWEEGAATIDGFLTAYQLLSYIGKAKKGEVVLLHAGASGLGTAAIQIAKTVLGCHIIATAGKEEKLDYCKKLGADGAFNYKDSHWASSVKALCATWGKSGVDLVLDPVGQSHASANMELLALDGRWVVYGLLSGGKVSDFSLDTVMRKRIAMTGTTLRGRPVEYKAALTRAFQADCSETLSNGKMKMVVDRAFKMEDIQEAHGYMEEDRNMGKVVVNVGQ